MDGNTKKALTSQEMLEEAIAFQRDVSRGKDRRGYGGASNQTPGAYGSGDRAAAGTSRGVSRQPAVSHQPAAQKLATPEQLFGRPAYLLASVPQNPPPPTNKKPGPTPVADFDPMHLDPRPGVPQDDRAAAKSDGPGLVGSRWATSALPRKEPSPVSNPGASAHVAPASDAPARAAIARDTGKADATTNKGASIYPSFPNAPLDTPEVPKATKGLLGSKWAAGASPASPSLRTPKYPDPSTLEPVYRSDDWLSDLSAEYEALSFKTKNALKTQPTQSSPVIKSPGVQTAAQTAKPPTNESQHSGQTTAKLSAAPHKNAAVQPAGRTGASHQTPDTNTGPSAELGRTATPAQPVSDQGGIFNDSAFKDWYNSQFMRRKT